MSFDINSVNPYIRLATQSVLGIGTKIKRRVIFDYELIYLECGEWMLIYDEKSYPCRAGQFVLLRPGIPHSIGGIEKDVSQPHIHFDMFYSALSPQIPISFKDLCDFSAAEQSMLQQDIFKDYPSCPFVTFNENDKALKLFYSIIMAPKTEALKNKSRLLELIEMLIYDNFPDCLSAPENDYGLARRLKDYIDAGQGMTAQLIDLEKQFSYSKYYLEQQFRKSYGIGLINYRNNRRMQTAAELLQRKSVTTVSEKLGFSSIYVFSRAFKQHFGMSPTEFKKSGQR